MRDLRTEIKRAKLRLLQMHFEAMVGHIGGNLSCLDALMVLFHIFRGDHDHVILSKGHAAGALYTTLWTVGVIPEEELRTFHGSDTRLAGHPVPGWLQQIPFATGSLGHGFSLSAGMAMAKRLKGEDGHVYCLTSDGEWQEGSTWEALIFAAHQRLRNLTVLIDVNGLQGFGRVDDVASLGSLGPKLKEFQVEVTEIDGHSPEDLASCLRTPAETTRIVLLNTRKGNGVSFMENSMEWHYLPMTQEQYRKAVEEISQV